LESTGGAAYQSADADRQGGAALLAAALVLARRRRLALGCLIVLLGDVVAAPLVSSLYVRPNELMLEKPYMERHIEATRSAFGLDRSRDVPFRRTETGRLISLAMSPCCRTSSVGLARLSRHA